MNLHQANGLIAHRCVEKQKGQITNSSRHSTPVLGIVSGKGGVGKSMLAVNLAVSAANMGASVLLVDGDLGLANTDLLMGLVPEFDLDDWIDERVRLEETICIGPAGLKVVIAGQGKDVADRIRKAAQGDEAWGLGAVFAQQDLVVLDLGAGIADDVIRLAQVCNPVWLVATPEATSLADAYATAKKLWERAPTLRVELIVNRAADRNTGDRTFQALSRLIQRFLSRRLVLRGMLPEDPEIGRSVARQSPLVIDSPNSPVARRLRLLAESILEEQTQSISRS